MPEENLTVELCFNELLSLLSGRSSYLYRLPSSDLASFCPGSSYYSLFVMFSAASFPALLMNV